MGWSAGCCEAVVALVIESLGLEAGRARSGDRSARRAGRASSDVTQVTGARDGVVTRATQVKDP
ncbi:hypothetical protein EBM89_02240 [Cellulomonas triticagri]|uniref:Uncharacterized protein n=1 Tax=Cellulomonas triticagri TaxID=2483352 RepID=A0A3M2JV04_9CELL|nr:hypothetical protein EBM89_02240 [Cellulomonas triticagri]